MSKLLINETPLQVLPSLVQALGGSKYLLDAIFLQQVQYYLSNPKMGKTVDGKKYVSFTYEEWHNQITWVEVDSIRAVVSRLKEKGVLLVGQYGDNPMDKSNFYAIDYDVLNSLLPSEQLVHIPVEGGDGLTSSGGVSSMIQRINTKKEDNSLKTDEEQGVYSGTSYQRGEMERPDKIDTFLQMTQFPGAKKTARVDAMQSAYGVAFVVNSETKEWKKLAEYAIEKQDKLGWEPERFIKWVKAQQGYPQFWTARRMLEQYPKAYEESQSKEQDNDRSHAL